MNNKLMILNYLNLTRINKPTGIFLLLIPCIWGVMLGMDIDLESIKILALLFTGSVVARSAGCIINDLYDYNIDKQVLRTQSRALASGKVSKIQAIIVLFALLLIGFAILAQFNYMAIALTLTASIFVITYPLMKRITYYPQFFLGCTFNFGILIGYAIVVNNIHLPAILLYIGAIFWTMGYDTIYAYQDKKDDLAIGVKSMAIRLGNNPKKVLYTLYAIMISIFAFVGYLMQYGFVYYLFLVLALIHSIWQIKSLDIYSPSNCNKRFKSNVVFGILISTGLLFS